MNHLILTAPEKQNEHFGGPAIFLAGPIQQAPDWQEQAIQWFTENQVEVLNLVNEVNSLLFRQSMTGFYPETINEINKMKGIPPSPNPPPPPPPEEPRIIREGQIPPRNPSFNSSGEGDLTKWDYFIEGIKCLLNPIRLIKLVLAQ